MNKLVNICSFLVLCAVFLSSCSFKEDAKSVNLALKKDGKTYLFSKIGTFITKDFLQKNTSPQIIQSTKIIEKDGELFAESGSLENIVDLISGNYILSDHQEKSYDGYVTQAKYKVFDKKYGSESTEKIGKMISTANINITDTAQTKEFHISWQRSPNQKALENCTEMSLWTDVSYKPGERTLTKKDYIMINLKQIVEFYGSQVTLNYVKDDEILYVLVN